MAVRKALRLSSRSDSTPVICKSEDLADRFPGYFRTPAQQEALLEAIHNASNIPPTIPRTNCSLVCGGNDFRQRREVRKNRDSYRLQEIISGVSSKHLHNDVTTQDAAVSLRRKRQLEGSMKLIHHGCCSSETEIVAPVKAVTISGEEVEVVQTDKYKQYFRTESCTFDPRCDLGCTCGQPLPFVYAAVVYDDKNASNGKDKYKQVHIKLPGCCKCLNVPTA